MELREYNGMTQPAFFGIATEAGIVRFNGIDFKTFTKKMYRADFRKDAVPLSALQGKIVTADQAIKHFRN
jgi:hypothetical protein